MYRQTHSNNQIELSSPVFIASCSVLKGIAVMPDTNGNNPKSKEQDTTIETTEQETKRRNACEPEGDSRSARTNSNGCCRYAEFNSHRLTHARKKNFVPSAITFKVDGSVVFVCASTCAEATFPLWTMVPTPGYDNSYWSLRFHRDAYKLSFEFQLFSFDNLMNFRTLRNLPNPRLQ